MDYKSMKRLIQWVRELLKRIIRSIRQWLNRSRFVLGLTCLVIGVSFTFSFYEGKPYYDQIKTYVEGQREGYAYAQEFLNKADKGVVVKAVAYPANEKSVMEEQDLSDTTSPVSLIEKYFGKDAEIAIAVAKAESNLNPLALNTKNRNGSTDCGIFQINSIHKPTKIQCEDAEENIKLAHQIFLKSGFRAWSAYNNGAYNKFLSLK